MFKTLTAGLTALSLIIIPAAPVHADQSNADRNRAIVGLLAAGAIGLAIKNHQDNRADSRTVQTHQPRVTVNRYNTVRPSTTNRQGNNRGAAQQRRAVDPVPGRCFRRVETARGGYQNVFLKECLERRYRHASTLPGRCQVRIGGHNGNRRGYDASCLRDFGYRSDQRRN